VEVTDLLVRVTDPFSIWLFGWLYEACVGRKVLYCWKSFDILYLVEDDQRQYLANTRGGARERKRVVMMLACRLLQMSLKFSHHLVEGLNYFQVDLNAFTYSRV